MPRSVQVKQGKTESQKPDLPCIANPDPLAQERHRFASYRIKSFYIHRSHLTDDFPYHLHPGMRVGAFEILYFEFRSIQSAEDHGGIGFLGDVWIKIGEAGQRKIYYKSSIDKWELWKGNGATRQGVQDRDQESHGRHPFLVNHYIWFNGIEVNWRTRDTVVRAHDILSLPMDEVISVIRKNNSHVKRKAEIKYMNPAGEKKQRLGDSSPLPTDRWAVSPSSSLIAQVDSSKAGPSSISPHSRKTGDRRPRTFSCVIDLTSEHPIRNSITGFLDAIGLQLPTADLVRHFAADGVVTAEELDRFAGLAQRKPVMFNNEALPELKKADRLSWMAIVDALQEKKVVKD